MSLNWRKAKQKHTGLTFLGPTHFLQLKPSLLDISFCRSKSCNPTIPVVSYHPTLPACFRARDRVRTALSSHERNNCIAQRLRNKREFVMPWGMKFWLPSEHVIPSITHRLTGRQNGVPGVELWCSARLRGYAIGHITARDRVNNNSLYMPTDLHWKIIWICVMVMCMHLKCQSPFNGFSKQLKRPEQSQFNSSGWFDTSKMYKIIPSHSSLWCKAPITLHSLEAFIIVQHSSWQSHQSAKLFVLKTMKYNSQSHYKKLFMVSYDVCTS